MKQKNFHLIEVQRDLITNQKKVSALKKYSRKVKQKSLGRESIDSRDVNEEN